MRVLIACEFSGVVRNAFRALGHDAWSLDLLPAEDESCYHIEGDALNYINDKDYEWDLMIAHPPCTLLCNSGVRWLAPKGILNQERHKAMQAACDFFAALYHAPIARICIENPIMHKYARDYLHSAWKVPAYAETGWRGTPYKGYSQTIQPWQFGHGEVKRTCLWLKNLPLLTPTNIVEGRTPRVHFASPGPNRWKERSRTLPGIAAAMAEQWTR